MSQTKAQLIDGKVATVEFSGGSASTPSIAFSGDTNTGIYSPGADQVAISTNGAGRLFINSSGRIGVGTDSPTSEFDLFENAASDTVLKVRNTAGTCWPAYLTSGGDMLFGLETSGSIQVRTNNSERLRVTSAGLVGIGTSSIRGTSLLDARGDISFGSNANYYGLLSYNAATGHIETTSSDGGFKWIRASGPATSMTLDSSGRLGIGTTSPQVNLDVRGAINAGNGTTRWAIINTDSDGAFLGTAGLNHPWVFKIGNGSVDQERMRLDTSGRLLVGTSTARDPNGEAKIESFNGPIAVSTFADSPGFYGLNFIKSRGTSTNVVVQNNDSLSGVRFFAADGTSFIEGARIEAAVDGTPGTNDMPGRLVFATTADGASSPTERVRISNGGDTSINTGGTAVNVASGTTDGATFFAQGASSGILQASSSGQICVYLRRRTSDGSIIQFRRDTTTVGSIDVTTTATSYVTSSDYRLKENVTPVTDGITRLQQLKPSRFNFIADPAKTVDGFIAHEVQDIVPEAITGEKDAVDDDGKPIYQGIDQSKLVPLLTAALQEAIGRIETLEAEVAALKG